MCRSMHYWFSCVVFLTASLAFQSNELTRGFSKFSNDFYWECAQAKSGNVIISPLSVANLLTLLSQGANGSTEAELKTALHLTIDKSTAAQQTLEYRESLQKNAGNAILSIANRIYVQQGKQLKKNFLDVAASKFQSYVESLNFAESEKSAQKINGFVNYKTNGKIKDLVKPDKLSSDTRSVLVNAIYFKGDWEVPFPEFLTHRGNFHMSEKEKVTVDFMNINHNFNYAEIEELKAAPLEMKYANSTLAFLMILPDNVAGLPELETKLKSYNLSQISEEMDDFFNVDVYIPKFKIEFDIELNDVLKNLGINEIFKTDGGLRGILESDEQLQVSDVLHKAFIEINEKGSRHAGGIFSQKSVECFQPEFKADHPFMFFIRDTETNTIIFSGRIVNFNFN